MRSGRVGAEAQVRCACVPEEVLHKVVCSAWRSSLRADAAAPDTGVAKEGRASGASHTGGWGGPASGMFRGTLQLELVN